MAEFDRWPPPEETLRCPFPWFEEARSAGPVIRLERPMPWGATAYLVTGHDACRRVLMDGETFHTRIDDEVENPLPFPDEPTFHEPVSIFSSNGEDHKVKRRWAMRLVERERLEVARAVIAREADRLIDGFAARGRCDFRREFADHVPINVMLALLGLTEEAIPVVKRLSALFARMESNPDPGDEDRAALARSWDEMHGLVGSRIDRALADPGSDYVSAIVGMQTDRDGALDRNALAMHLEMVLFGGDHAVAGFVTDLAVMLARNPEIQHLLRSDSSKIRRFALETLRIEPAVPWLTRVCMRDTELAGTRIPAGAHIVVATAAANRDPAEFDRPADFLPERENLERRMMTFGQGPHRCSGQALALMEAEVIVQRLLDRLEDIALDPALTYLTTELSYQFRVPTQVHLTFRQR